MEAELTKIAESASGLMGEVAAYVSQPWFLYQVIVIALLFMVSQPVGRWLEKRLESRARAIKGQPHFLRMLIALMRRMNWVVFALFLFGALTLMRSLTWPSRSLIVSLALSLVLAWVIVTVLSRIIRNRVFSRAIALIAWLYVAAVILAIDDDVSQALDAMAVQFGSFRLTVLVAIKAVLLLTAAIWLASTIGNFVEERVKRSEELSPAIRVLIGKIAKIGLIVIAAIAALSAIGIDLTAFTVFSGAVGVGLGFGLQKVVSNFISGVIILADRSIKPGDTISLGNTFGWIRELRARFVSVITRDGREFLIPNEDFVTQQVINWSFSDELVRLDVDFGVSYEADPHEVTELAIAAAMTVGRVDANRKPVCWMTGFGDSSIDFVLRFWIRDPQQGLTNIRGKVLLALWDAFKENGVGIPFPHREVIFKQGSVPVDAVIRRPGAQKRSSNED